MSLRDDVKLLALARAAVLQEQSFGEDSDRAIAAQAEQVAWERFFVRLDRAIQKRIRDTLKILVSGVEREVKREAQGTEKNYRRGVELTCTLLRLHARKAGDASPGREDQT